MKYKEILPHDSLQDYVKCFWILEREYSTDDPHEIVTPDAFVELMFNFGAPYILVADGAPDLEMPTAFIVGLLKKPLLFRSSGTVRLVSTRFYVWGTAGGPNLLFFGEQTLYEGHKTEVQRGFGWTMVFTDEVLINARLKIFDGLFESARRYVLQQYRADEKDLIQGAWTRAPSDKFETALRATDRAG